MNDGEELFGRAIEPHRLAIVRYALRRVGDEATAEDVAAEVMRVAWERRDVWRAEPEDRHLPWLYGVARHVVANELRSRTRASRLVERIQHQPGTAHAAADHAEALALSMALSAALERLSEDEREIIMLAAWEGLTTGQIAQVLGLRTTTAASMRLKRARKRLRVLMDEPDAAARPAQRAVRRTV